MTLVSDFQNEHEECIHLQHLGRSDLFKNSISDDTGICENCGTEISDEEISHCQTLCFTCYDTMEPNDPSPFDVYGREGIL
jgi:RNA polymerase-binding transcription factor DksA